MNQRPTEKELRDMIDKGMTLYQISRKYNTTIPVIFQLEKDYDIRSQYDSPKMIYRNINKEDIEYMYIDEGMNQKQIAEELGCSKGHVQHMMDHYHIQTRANGKYTTKQRASKIDEIMQRYNNGETQEQIAEKVGYSRGNVKRIIRERGVQTRGSTGMITTQKLSLITAGNLQELIDKGMNQAQISQYFGVSDWKIFDLCEKFNITGMVDNFRCTTPEYQSWKYDVLDRYHRTCQLCGKTGVRLEVHHIIKWADATDIRYNIDNGVPLCEECHRKVTGHEYEYAQQFLDITQPQCREHEIIESMPWEPPLELHSIIDYPEEKVE